MGGGVDANRNPQPSSYHSFTIINMSLNEETGTITLTLQGADPDSKIYLTIPESYFTQEANENPPQESLYTIIFPTTGTQGTDIFLGLECEVVATGTSEICCKS